VPPPPVAGATVGNGLGDEIGVGLGGSDDSVGVGVGDWFGLAVVVGVPVLVGVPVSVGVAVPLPGRKLGDPLGVLPPHADTATETSIAATPPVATSLALRAIPAMVVLIFMRHPQPLKTGPRKRWRP